jgi:hypothetical protein
MGAFGGFIRAGIPVNIVNDYQLEHNQLKGYQLLFLSNPNELTSVQKNSIRQFVSRGGILMKNNAGLAWSEPGTNAEAAQAFHVELQSLTGCIVPPVQVFSSTERLHAVAFEDSLSHRLVVAVTNDYSWIQWVSGDSPIDPADIHPSPPPVQDAVVVVKNRTPPTMIREVISHIPVFRENIPQGYRVRLPAFQTMALLVIHEKETFPH